jgi:hypothetical protein
MVTTSNTLVRLLAAWQPISGNSDCIPWMCDLQTRGHTDDGQTVEGQTVTEAVVVYVCDLVTRVKS